MKRLIPILLMLVLLLSLVGCAGAAKDEYYPAEAPAYEPAQAYEEEALYDGYESADSASGSSAVSEGQKLIRKVNLTAETEDYYAFMDKLSATVASLGGYMENVEARTSGSAPSAELTIRVPAQNLEQLTQQVNGYSNITYRSESQTDVTLQYVDNESRISALKTELNRLLALLEQAEDLEQILLLEDRMTEVRYQLEKTESSQRALSNQIDYATVRLDIRQVEVFTEVEEPSYWQSVGSGFADSLDGLWNFLKNLFRILIAALPYLLVFVVVPLVILLVCLRNGKRKRAAKQQQTAEAPALAAEDAPAPAEAETPKE